MNQVGIVTPQFGISLFNKWKNEYEKFPSKQEYQKVQQWLNHHKLNWLGDPKGTNYDGYVMSSPVPMHIGTRYGYLTQAYPGKPWLQPDTFKKSPVDVRDLNSNLSSDLALVKDAQGKWKLVAAYNLKPTDTFILLRNEEDHWEAQYANEPDGNDSFTLTGNNKKPELPAGLAWSKDSGDDDTLVVIDKTVSNNK